MWYAPSLKERRSLLDSFEGPAFPPSLLQRNRVEAPRTAEISSQKRPWDDDTNSSGEAYLKQLFDDPEMITEIQDRAKLDELVVQVVSLIQSKKEETELYSLTQMSIPQMPGAPNRPESNWIIQIHELQKLRELIDERIFQLDYEAQEKVKDAQEAPEGDTGPLDQGGGSSSVPNEAGGGGKKRKVPGSSTDAMMKKLISEIRLDSGTSKLEKAEKLRNEGLPILEGKAYTQRVTILTNAVRYYSEADLGLLLLSMPVSEQQGDIVFLLSEAVQSLRQARSAVEAAAQTIQSFSTDSSVISNETLTMDTFIRAVNTPPAYFSGYGEGDSRRGALDLLTVGQLNGIEEWLKIKVDEADMPSLETFLGTNVYRKWIRSKDRANADRVKAEADRVKAEADRVKAAKKEEADRVKAEAGRVKAEADRVKADADRVKAAEKAEADRVKAAEKAEADRVKAVKKAEADRVKAGKAEAGRVKAAEKERKAREKAEAEEKTAVDNIARVTKKSTREVTQEEVDAYKKRVAEFEKKLEVVGSLAKEAVKKLVSAELNVVKSWLNRGGQRKYIEYYADDMAKEREWLLTHYSAWNSLAHGWTKDLEAKTKDVQYADQPHDDGADDEGLSAEKLLKKEKRDQMSVARRAETREAEMKALKNAIEWIGTLDEINYTAVNNKIELYKLLRKELGLINESSWEQLAENHRIALGKSRPGMTKFEVEEILDTELTAVVRAIRDWRKDSGVYVLDSQVVDEWMQSLSDDEKTEQMLSKVTPSVLKDLVKDLVVTPTEDEDASAAVASDDDEAKPNKSTPEKPGPSDGLPCADPEIDLRGTSDAVQEWVTDTLQSKEVIKKRKAKESRERKKATPEGQAKAAEALRKKEEKERKKEERDAQKAETAAALKQYASSISTQAKSMGGVYSNKPLEIAAKTMTYEANRVIQQNAFDNWMKDRSDAQSFRPPAADATFSNQELAKAPVTDEQLRALFVHEAIFRQLEIHHEQKEQEELAKKYNDAQTLSAATPKPTKLTDLELGIKAKSALQTERLKLFYSDLPEGMEVEMQQLDSSGSAKYSAEARLNKLLKIGNPLLFNKAYAKRLLVSHLRRMKELQVASVEKNPRAAYTDVGSALGKDPEEAADEMLPSFEAMLRYRLTIMKVKEIQTAEKLLTLVDVAGGKRVEATKLLLKLRKQPGMSSAVPAPDWWLESSMPSWDSVVSARWVNEWEINARRLISSQKKQLPGQFFGPQPLFLPLRVSAPPRVGKSAITLLLATVGRRLGMKILLSVAPNKTTPITEMKTKLETLRWLPAAVVGENATVVSNRRDRVFTWNLVEIDSLTAKGVPDGASAIDMLVYSSDNPPGDARRAGSLLDNWSDSAEVVLHVHDEAQSLVHAEVNLVKFGNVNKAMKHAGSPPPPETLQYLRAYNGNIFGLNVNVTATHFPVFSEETMWGFTGSVRQKLDALLPPNAPATVVNKQLGALLLPSLVPALRPPDSLMEGYVGSDHLVPWVPPSNGKPLVEAPENQFLSEGTNKAAADADLQQIVSDASAGGAQKTPAPAKRTTRVTRKKDASKAIVEEEGEEAKKRREQDALKELASLKSAQALLEANNDVDYDPEDDEERSAPKSQPQQQLEREQAKSDLTAISNHFLDFMKAKESNINDIREPPENELAPEFRGANRDLTMVPMYLGALNRKHLSDAALASFVPLFAKLARKKIEASCKDKKLTRSKAGLVQLLFTSAVRTLEHVETILGITVENVAGSREAGNRRLDEVMRDGKKASTKANTNLVAFVYDPVDDMGTSKATTDDPKTPVKLRVYRFFGADEAIPRILDQFGISRFAVLGYGMLSAGLTVQTAVFPDKSDTDMRNPTRMFVPQYLAFATSSTSARDTQLQIAGRSFFDLKRATPKGEVEPIPKPSPAEWPIYTLAYKGFVTEIQTYASMEARLAETPSVGATAAVFEAFEDAFTPEDLAKFSTLGTVGTRETPFLSMIGRTPDSISVPDVQADPEEDEAPAGEVPLEQLMPEVAMVDARAGAQLASGNPPATEVYTRRMAPKLG